MQNISENTHARQPECFPVLLSSINQNQILYCLQDNPHIEGFFRLAGSTQLEHVFYGTALRSLGHLFNSGGDALLMDSFG